MRKEAQSFELAAIFSIEIAGSLRIKENGSRNPGADNWVEFSGGFFLRITPDRFELFITGQASMPSLALSGEATGLVILDANDSLPGRKGIAGYLSLELSVGARPDIS